MNPDRMGKTNSQVDLIEFDESLEDIERIKPEALSKYLKQKPKELNEIKDIEKLTTSWRYKIIVERRVFLIEIQPS